MPWNLDFRPTKLIDSLNTYWGGGDAEVLGLLYCPLLEILDMMITQEIARLLKLKSEVFVKRLAYS